MRRERGLAFAGRRLARLTLAIVGALVAMIWAIRPRLVLANPERLPMSSTDATSPLSPAPKPRARSNRWRPWGALGLLVVALAPLAWYLLSPLFVDRRAQDDPAAAGATASGTIVARERFGEVDAIHKGEGQAVLTHLPDGRYSLRFEGFRVTNGPDLYVYLSGHPAPRSSAQLHEAGDLELAALKGNVGDQTYELPAGFDPAGFKSVVVYCKRFTTVFSTAELRPI